MTDKTNQCAEHPWCKDRIEKCENRLNNDIDPAIERIKEIQQARDSQFAMYVPKTWLWIGLGMLSPIYAFVFGLSVYIATTDVRFADKQTVLNHEYRLVAIEKVIEDQHRISKQIMTTQLEILEKIGK